MESEKEIRFVFLEIDPSRKYFPFMSITRNPWFLQVEDDLKIAKLAFANGFYSQTYYHASQSAEKALKSIIIDLGELPPKINLIHPIGQLLPRGEKLHGLKNNWILQFRAKPCVQNDSNR